MTSASTDRPAPEEVRTVVCVGAGTIGGGWVAYFLARGYRAVTRCRSRGSASSAGSQARTR